MVLIVQKLREGTNSAPLLFQRNQRMDVKIWFWSLPLIALRVRCLTISVYFTQHFQMASHLLFSSTTHIDPPNSFFWRSQDAPVSLQFSYHFLQHVQDVCMNTNYLPTATFTLFSHSDLSTTFSSCLPYSTTHRLFCFASQFSTLEYSQTLYHSFHRLTFPASPPSLDNSSGKRVLSNETVYQDLEDMPSFDPSFVNGKLQIIEHRLFITKGRHFVLTFIQQGLSNLFV